MPYLRTVGLYALTLWALVTLVFFLPRFMPGDPLRQLEDPDCGTFLPDQSERDRVAPTTGSTSRWSPSTGQTSAI